MKLAEQVVELFEELFEKKGIEIPCADKTEQKDRYEGGNEAKLYGMEYWNLVEKVEAIMSNSETMNDKEKWFILSNNSDCDDLSVYSFYGTREDAYKKMQALVLVTAERTEEGHYLEIDMNSSEMTAYIQWSGGYECFRIVKVFDVIPIDEADGVKETNLDMIPDDIHWNNEMAHEMIRKAFLQKQEYPFLSEKTRDLVKTYCPEEDIFNGMKRYKGFFLEADKCYSLAVKFGWTESVKTEGIAGDVFNKDELFSISWVEGEFYLIPFRNKNEYEKELMRVKKWYAENE